MLIYLRDYANAITAAGYVFAILGLFLALNGRIELGTASMLWMWFLDHWDGHVARKMDNRRRPGMADFGKSFDGFGDFFHGVLFPSTVIVLIGNGSLLSFIAVLSLVMAGALRLSYFANVGLTSNARFQGIPVSYDTPLVAIFLLGKPAIPDGMFATLLCVAFIVLAALHVATPVQVPAIRGKAVPVASVVAACVSVALAILGQLNTGFGKC